MIKMTLTFELSSEDSEHEDEASATDGQAPPEWTKRQPKNPGRGKRRKIQCPQCQKILSKVKQTLFDHYKSFHKYVPNDQRDEEIKIVTKESKASKERWYMQYWQRCNGRYKNMLQSVQVLWSNIISVTLLQRPPESRLHHEMHWNSHWGIGWLSDYWGQIGLDLSFNKGMQESIPHWK